MICRLGDLGGQGIRLPVYHALVDVWHDAPRTWIDLSMGSDNIVEFKPRLSCEVGHLSSLYV